MNSKSPQHQTPFFTKLKQAAESKITCFDVPGHKQGHLNNDMQEYCGPNVFKLDLNAPIGLDNLSHPEGVIKEAQKLMAEAFSSDDSHFLINGSTQGILAMIMSECRANEKILLPRNVHKSVINALVLSGAIPVFIKPDIDNILGITNNVSYDVVEKAILENPDAKVLFLINPTYFGVVSDISRITKLAHDNNIKVLVDEAHGAHFYFCKNLPLGAMQAGADMSSVSVHKTLGSLTQSSVLLTRKGVIDQSRLRSTINILNSTSPSPLLMASLDVSRKNMYINGENLLNKVISMADKARDRINKIPGVEAISPEYFLNRGEFGFDQTRLIVKVSDLGITGFDAYKQLRAKFNIQMELAETHLVLAILSAGTQQKDINNLIKALEKLSQIHLKENREPIHPKAVYVEPEYFMRPREAYHSEKKYVSYEDSAGEIAAEQIMIYPPGIPFLIPGEKITKELVEDLKFYIKQGSTILSDSYQGLIKVVDFEKSKKED